MNEVAYHDYALAVSRESGIFYRDDRRDAKEFLAGKSTICRIAQAVEEKGFMVLLEPRTRLANGQLASGKYQVLTHKEWAAYHPGECRGVSACPADGTGVDDTQSQNQGSPVPFSEVTCPADGTGPVPFWPSACPTGGTKNREERIEKREKREERQQQHQEREALAPLRPTVVENVVDAAPPSETLGASRQRQWEKPELLGALREIYERCTYHTFAATKTHEDAVVELVGHRGADMVLAAFELWCRSNPPEMFTVQVKDKVIPQPIAWPLQKFVSQGYAVECLTQLEPYAHLVAYRGDTLQLLIDKDETVITDAQAATLRELINVYGFDMVRSAVSEARSVRSFLQAGTQFIQTAYLHNVAWELGTMVGNLTPETKTAALAFAEAAGGYEPALQMISDADEWRSRAQADFVAFCRANMAAAAQVAAQVA